MIRATAWESRTFRVVNLSLDRLNVRLDIAHLTQDSVINDLFENENAFQIVQSILTNGLYNNELPIVVEEGNKFVVVEGNRRVAALKAILNPKIVPAFEKRIETLVDGADVSPLEEIEVKVAPSREDASSLIASVHTITSRRPWRPLRQAYFYHAQLEGGKKTIEDLIKEYPNIAIPKFVRMWEMHGIVRSLDLGDDESASSVNSRNFNITNLERLYDIEKFRDQFGIRFDRLGRVSISSDRKEFEAAFAQVVRDIVGKRVTSRTVNTSEQLDKFLKEWQTPGPKPAGNEDATFEDFEPSPKSGKAKSRPAVVPADILSSVSAVGVQKRLDELKALPYRRYPMATLDSLRSLLECSLKAFCAESGIEVQPKRPGGFVFLEDVLIAVRKYLKENNLRKDLDAPLGKIINRQEMFSLKLEFDSINHNPHMFTNPSEVKAAWDQIDAIVRFALEPKDKQ